MTSEIKSEEDIEMLRENALLVSRTLAEVGKHIAPGVSTLELDKVAEEFIRDHGAVPGFLNYDGFPNTLCISVNSVVIHGIPSGYRLKEGDIVSLDCGTKYKGFCGDSAYTFAVGRITPEAEMLLKVTKESLYKGIENAVAGKRMGDISYAIQRYAESFNCSIVREFVGHGLGTSLHESPEVPNYGRLGQGVKLKEGMVLCIEPMVNLGKRHVLQEDDGWTIRTIDNSLSAHFELTVVIRKNKAEVLSTFDFIEETLKN